MRSVAALALGKVGKSEIEKNCIIFFRERNRLCNRLAFRGIDPRAVTAHILISDTARVERLNIGSDPSQLIAAVSNYIQHHISESVTTEAIAQSLYISRTHLSARFHKETGMTLSDFILKEKTEEAKSLLRYTYKSLAAISAYLGFSSQSHFSRTFRKYAGVTPGEYRAKHAGH